MSTETITIPDPFTVLNTIVGILFYPLSLPFALLSRFPAVQPGQMQQVQLPQLPLPAAKVTNAETWEWRDYSGKKIVITVHRDVKRVN